MANPGFKQIRPKTDIEDLSENIIRAVFRDQTNHIWAASKSGQIYILSPELQLLHTINNITLVNGQKIWL